MDSKHFDVIIIGSGPGGYQAAAHAAREGLSVCIAEESEAGGTCLNRGCIPTKALCHDAELARMAAATTACTPDATAMQARFAEAMSRKAEVVAQLRSGVESLLAAPGITLVRGRAQLLADATVQTPEGCLTADNIIIATGSRSAMPPIAGLDLPGVVTSTGMLDTTTLPSRLCIVGAGVIGLELAGVFSSFGTKVTVVEFMRECLSAMDSDIAKRLRKQMERAGIAFELGTAVKRIDEGLRVTIEKKGREAVIEADMVLVATGRVPRLDAIDTEGLHIATHRRGICVDATTFEVVREEGAQTPASPRIFAIGDVNGCQMLAHAAEAQARRVVNTIMGRCDGMRLDVMPAAVFTTPEAACVGPTDEALKARGAAFRVYKATFRANGRALCIGQTEGLVKVITDEHDRLLACHAVGPHAASIVQELTAYIALGATLRQLLDTVHIHPTLSEVLLSLA